MARPRIKIDPEEVERLAARGLTHTQICDVLGISVDTLARRKKDTQAITDALRRGRARGVRDIADALYQRALEGNVRAQTFFLKARAGWSETASRPHAVDPYSDDRRYTEMDLFNQRITAYLRAQRNHERTEQG